MQFFTFCHRVLPTETAGRRFFDSSFGCSYWVLKYSQHEKTQIEVFIPFDH